MNRLYICLIVIAALASFACSDKKTSSKSSKSASGNTDEQFNIRHAPNPKARRQAQTEEAVRNLRKMFDGAIRYYQNDHSARGGQAQLLDKLFPDSAQSPAGWAGVTCEGGDPRKFVPDGDTWSADTWIALDFAISDPFRYLYTFESEGAGTEARFTVRANGDLNCDGRLSTFEMIGEINDKGEVVGGAKLYSDKELE